VWAKKIKGKLHYFGPWEDPQGALAKYEAEKEALHAGKKPRADPEALTVKQAANHFLNAKQALVDTGELSPLTFKKYREAAEELVAAFGKSRLVADLDTSDFAGLRERMAKRWGLYRRGDCMRIIRGLFKHADEAGLIDRVPRYGPQFKPPSAKSLRLHRAAQGPRLFTAEQIRHMIAAAGVQLKAMLLLGINCGYGNTDCGRLPLSALDLDGGVIDFPRPKTGVPRRCHLWPETVQALRDVLAARLEPKRPGADGLVFLTRCGRGWDQETAGGVLSREMAKLLRSLHINGRKGLGFYTLRHVFRTVADESKDQVAVDYVMGHARDDMASTYRETISDDRLRAVADHVRRWLSPPA
jgi:integrase